MLMISTNTTRASWVHLAAQIEVSRQCLMGVASRWASWFPLPLQGLHCVSECCEGCGISH